jgi:hypothetical protein
MIYFTTILLKILHTFRFESGMIYSGVDLCGLGCMSLFDHISSTIHHMRK